MTEVELAIFTVHGPGDYKLEDCMIHEKNIQTKIGTKMEELISYLRMENS